MIGDGQHIDTGCELQAAERRSRVRASTLRHLLFSASRAGSLLRRGTAVDISSGGLRIATRRPESVGTPIHIEIQPKKQGPQGEVVFVRGEVKWVLPTGHGEYAMGVAMRVMADTGHGQSVSLSSQSAAHLVESVKHGIRRLGEDGTVAVAFSPDAFSDTPREVRFQKAASGRRRRRRVALACLLIALIGIVLLLLVYPRPQSPPRTPAVAARPTGIPGEVDPSTGVKPPEASTGMPGAPGHASRGRPPGKAPSDLLSSAQVHLASGQTPEANDQFEEVLAHPDSNEVERFLARVGRAQAAAGAAEMDTAMAEMDLAMERIEAIPRPWAALAREMQARLFRRDLTLVDAPLMSEALDIEAALNAQGNASELRIEVDKSDYVMTVFKAGQILRRFPVGLGRNDATPEGDYEIVNKITDPDWYNRGEVVEAGDPANPLGRRWLGLGRGTSATSYGIHPTPAPDSIGQPKSRGCIRMTPADAEVVFRLCPIGTPVRIHSGDRS